MLRAAAFFQSEGPDAVFMRLQGEMLAGHTVVAWVLRRQMSGVDVLKKKGGLQAALHGPVTMPLWRLQWQLRSRVPK